MLRMTVRCAFGKRDGLKSIRECIHNYELDVETLLWTRGPNFPIERLASRLMCPRCNSRKVRVEIFTPVDRRLVATIGPS
jgi:hypothetical protein